MKLVNDMMASWHMLRKRRMVQKEIYFITVQTKQQQNIDRKQSFICPVPCSTRNGFKGGRSWNFFKDGHDNWEADGFGGDLKWTADKFDLIQPRSEQCQSCHDYNAEI